MLEGLAFAAYVLCFVAAAASDLVRYQIPNTVCLVLAGAFALHAPAMPLTAAGAHLLAGLAMMAVAAAGFAFRLMGGGDAKLLAAATLWMGWQDLLPFLFVTAMAGAAIGIFLLAARRLAPDPPPEGRWWSLVMARSSGIPYGIAISAAGLLMLPRLGAPLLH